MDRGAWRATVYGVAESDTTEQLTLSFSRVMEGFPGGSDGNLPAMQGTWI